MVRARWWQESSSPPAVWAAWCQRVVVRQLSVAARARRRESTNVSLRYVSATFPGYSAAADDGRKENVQQRERAKRIGERVQKILANLPIDDRPPDECCGDRDRCPEDGGTLRRKQNDREREGQRRQELQQRWHQQRKRQEALANLSKRNRVESTGENILAPAIDDLAQRCVHARRQLIHSQHHDDVLSRSEGTLRKQEV